jgi:pimeloyl-ACP methyl ester carboxylesterase
MAPSKPLLLLPGLMCDHSFWQPLIESPAAQSAGLACQVVDYGDADSLPAMAQRALDVAPPRFALAGHSMGGRVALEVVRLAPARVQQLIVMDTGYLPLAVGEAGERERAGRMALLELARTQGVHVMCAEWVQGMVHPQRVSDSSLMAAIAQMFARKSADRFALQQHALLTRPDPVPVLASLAALGLPTLFLCGRQDAWSTPAQHEAMQHIAGGTSRLCVVENAGHMVLMERPAETVQALLQFLAAS